MDTQTILLIAVVVAVFVILGLNGFFLFQLYLNRKKNENTDSSFADQSRYITKELTEIKAISNQTLSFTERLQSLEQILKNPHRRGALGEYVLEQIVADILPPNSYATQHTFSNNLRADVVIFLRKNMKLCIDAKFSLENYVKLLKGELDDPSAVQQQLAADLKGRIKETAKYIIPEEGTLDYAFMFIPSETLYYDVLTNTVGSGDSAQNLIEHAFKKYKVIIVSPTTLFAYLETVNFGLQALHLEENTKKILKHARKLEQHLTKHTEAFTKIGKTLTTTVNHYNEAEKQYQMINKDFMKIADETEDGM